MSATTKPSPSDQAAPLQRPVPLSDLALSAGITPEHVGAYVRDHAAYLTSPYRLVRSDIGLVSL